MKKKKNRIERLILRGSRHFFFQRQMTKKIIAVSRFQR